MRRTSARSRSVSAIRGEIRPLGERDRSRASFSPSSMRPWLARILALIALHPICVTTSSTAAALALASVNS